MVSGSFKGVGGLISGRFRADPCKNYGCFYKLGVLFADVLVIRALLFGVYSLAPTYQKRRSNSLKKAE